MNAGCNLITRLVLTKTDENKLDFMTDCMTWIKRLERKSNVKQAFLLMSVIFLVIAQSNFVNTNYHFDKSSTHTLTWMSKKQSCAVASKYE